MFSPTLAQMRPNVRVSLLSVQQPEEVWGERDPRAGWAGGEPDVHGRAHTTAEEAGRWSRRNHAGLPRVWGWLLLLVFLLILICFTPFSLMPCILSSAGLPSWGAGAVSRGAEGDKGSPAAGARPAGGVPRRPAAGRADRDHHNWTKKQD